MKPHQRYSDAHKLGFDTQYPQAAQAGHYFKPSMPDCRTANGSQICEVAEPKV